MFFYLDLADEIFPPESSWRERYQVVSDVGDEAVSKFSMGKHVSAKELASYLSLHVKTVLKMARAGILPAVRLSKRCVRFDLEECARIIRGRTSG